MILVSMRFPEGIPWFKASRRAVVAAMFAGGFGASNVCHESCLYRAGVRTRECVEEGWNENDKMTVAQTPLIYGSEAIYFNHL